MYKLFREINENCSKSNTKSTWKQLKVLYTRYLKQCIMILNKEFLKFWIYHVFDYVLQSAWRQIAIETAETEGGVDFILKSGFGMFTDVNII